ncbi:MAG: hypothetical protein GX171_03470 [Clostridiales bacterium]|jgi:hypothetical protein|nr:hypothetical protein [Clostridiales bacterium]
MKKFFTFMLVAVLTFCVASALAEGKLTVTSKNVIIKIGDDSGIFVAKVENTGDEPIYYDNGKLVIFSADDDILVSESYIYSSPSNIFLKPGEYTYCYDFLWDSTLKNAKIGDIKFSVTSDTSGYKYEQIPSTAVLELPGNKLFTYNYVNVTFTNTTDEILYGAYVVAAITDNDNNIVYVDRQNYESIGIHPGSTVTVKLYIDGDYINYYEINGINLDNVESQVFYSTEQ